MKRLSLFLVLALALSAMLIACGKKDESGSAKGCTQDWLNVFPEGKENAKIFQITQMNSVAKANSTTAAFVAAGADSCEGFSDDSDRKAAITADCSNSSKEFDGSYHANFTPANNSVVAVYREGNDKLRVITKLEMDNSNNAQENGKSNALNLSKEDRYQYTEFNAISITDTVVEGTCIYHLSGGEAGVSVTAFNVDNMNKSTGDPKNAGKVYPNTNIDFYFDFDTKKMEIVSVLKGKEAQGIQDIQATTTIKAVNVQPQGATSSNKMANTSSPS